MITHRQIRKLLGQHVNCHTHFGTFHGVIVHFTKHHVILGSMTTPRDSYQMEAEQIGYFPRQMPMGPGGPMGPGPGWGGGGWHVAIPLAAIIGITALGMHWW